MPAGCLLSVLSFMWMLGYLTWYYLRDMFTAAGWAKPVDDQQATQAFSRAMLVGLILLVVGALLFVAFPAR